MRPRTLDEFVGQEHLVAPGMPLRVMLEQDELTSHVFWGPPGSGKTTLARIIAGMTASEFVPFSAVLSGIKEIKQVMLTAERARAYGRRTVVFIDEIHRFNKAQQDAFLPHVEKGNIILMREVGYGSGYQYAHDYPEKTSSMPCLPESLRNRRYYLPTEEGFEQRLRERLAGLLKLWGKK